LGSWIFTYDALGNTLTQRDNKGQLTQFHYDVLGRMDNRTDPGASAPDTVWTWDNAANGIGLIGTITGPNGYQEQYRFDSAARRSGVTTTAAGVTYDFAYGYDPTQGELSSITYPTGTSGRFEVLYEYQNGYVKDVKDYNNLGTVFWQAIAQDAA